MKEEKTYTREPVPLNFSYKGKMYRGQAVPLSDTCSREVCFALDVMLNEAQLGVISAGRDMHWIMNGAEQGPVNAIGEEILLWYE